MNRYIAIGRLTGDPEIRYAQNANKTAVASFSIAIDRKFKREGEPTADFFNCTAFGKIAEFCEKYLTKGTKVALEGHLQNDSYEKDGVKKTITKILIDSIEFAESKKDSQADSGENKSDSGEKKGRKAAEPAASNDIYEDLPFA